VSTGVVYELKGMILYSVPAANAIGWGLTFPAMTHAAGRVVADTTINGAGLSSFSIIGVADFEGGDSGSIILSTLIVGTGGVRFAKFEGVLVPSATGVVQLATRTSVTTNPVIVLRGSFVRVYRVN
jgi:hypothetical protein